jgi:hypothetical protein
LLPRWPPRTRRVTSLATVVVILLVGARVLAVGIALDGAATRGRRTVLPGDVRRYHRIATHRGAPYRDFAVEYPPLTLAAIDLVDGTGVRQTTVRLMWSQLVLDLAVVVLLAWGWGRRTAIAYLLLGLAFVWYPFLYLRLDLLSVVLAIGGLAVVRKRQNVLGGIALGVACFAKVWPLALAPALVARRAWRALAAFAISVAAGLGAWVLWGGIDGPVQVFTFRGAKGWQAESSVGAIVHLVHGGRAVMEQGAARVSEVPGWAKLALLLVAVAIVVLTAVLARRVPSDDLCVHDGLVPLAGVAAMLATATILSPQYVSWLLPFAAIAASRNERIIGTLTFAVAALSTLGLNLGKELNVGDPLPMTVVVVRNALLVALLAMAVVRIAQARRTPRPPDTTRPQSAKPVPVPMPPQPVGHAPQPVAALLPVEASLGPNGEAASRHWRS